jgi:hypothetical protein
MTAVLAANSGAVPLEEVKRERFRPPRAGILCARASSIGGAFRLSTSRLQADPAGDESLTYPVTFSQCNKNLRLCYNPRREFRNCEIRQAPGFLPGESAALPSSVSSLPDAQSSPWPQPPSRTHRSPDVASSPILLNSLN